MFSTLCRAHPRPVGSAPPGPLAAGLRTCAPASDGVAVLARVDNGVRRYITTVASFVVGNNINAFFFVRCDSVRSTAGGEIPQNLPRRHLRRLALSAFGGGVGRFCGNLALRTFQCSPFHGSAFQCCAYGSLLIFTPTGICNCQYPFGASFHRKAWTSWRPRSRHCAPFYGRAGIHALLWVPLPVFKCCQTISPHVVGSGTQATDRK